MLRNLIAAAAAVTLVGSVGLSAAEAMPVAPAGADHAAITLVAGGCGVGWHRGPYGGCRRNRVWHRPMVRHCWTHRTPWGWRRVCR